jgi:aminopeptidase-like protein
MSPLTGVSKILQDERVFYEVFNFIDGKSSLLEIRNAASAEYAPIPLQDVKSFMEALAKADVIKLSPAASKK